MPQQVDASTFTGESCSHLTGRFGVETVAPINCGVALSTLSLPVYQSVVGSNGVSNNSYELGNRGSGLSLPYTSLNAGHEPLATIQ